MKNGEKIRVTYEDQVELTSIPEWIDFILKGQKINAIKTLRQITRIPQTGDHIDDIISLVHAKMIVEEMENHIGTIRTEISRKTIVS